MEERNVVVGYSEPVNEDTGEFETHVHFQDDFDVDVDDIIAPLINKFCTLRIERIYPSGDDKVLVLKAKNVLDYMPREYFRTGNYFIKIELD